MVVADLYQSAGTLPVNVRELGVDFATGGSREVAVRRTGRGLPVRAPRSCGSNLTPRPRAGWRTKSLSPSRAEPITYTDSIYRFLNGTPNVPAMYAAQSGYEIVNQIGVPAIREKSVRQTSRLIELADEAGFAVNTCRNPAQRGGVVVLDVPDGQEVTQELARRQILVDYRPQAGIRVAPHFYTTDEEIDHTVSEIRSIVSAGVNA